MKCIIKILVISFIVCVCNFCYLGIIMKKVEFTIQSNLSRRLLYISNPKNNAYNECILATYMHFKSIENQLLSSVPEDSTLDNTLNDYTAFKKKVINKIPSNMYDLNDTNTPFWNAQTPSETKLKIWQILKADEKRFFRNFLGLKLACDPRRKLNQVGKYVCYKLALAKAHPFSYKVGYTISTGNIHITVSETQFGLPTRGGSSFKAEIQTLDSGLMLNCPVQDTFDGKYHIECPVVFTKHCVWIQITRLFHDYLAFMESKREAPQGSFDRPLIWTQAICENLQASMSSVHEGWALQNGTWRWMKAAGGHLPEPVDPVSKERITQCISSLSSLTMIGASHMRYTADFLGVNFQQHFNASSASFDHAIGHKHHLFHTFSFVWANFAESVANFISKLRVVNDTKMKSTDVVVFQTGAWDVPRNGAEGFFEKTQLLIESVKRLRSSPLWRDSRVIWMTSIAVPHIIFTARNNIITQAMNEHLRRELRPFGVEEVDTFGVTFPRNNEALKFGHYLVNVDHVGPDFAGVLGQRIAYNLVNTLCPH